LILLHMGLHRGWWHNFSETPLFNQDRQMEIELEAEDVVVGELAAMAADARVQREDAEAPLPRTVKESNEALEGMRTTASGNLHFSALFLCRSRERRLWKAAVGLSEPFRVRHGKDIVMSSTKEGQKQLYSRWATDGNAPLVSEIIGMLSSNQFAFDIGFNMHGGDRYSKQENAFLLKYVLQFTCHLSYARLLS